MFLLQAGCHASFSFKPNITHLNLCKGAGGERKTVSFHAQLKTATHSENCSGMELASEEICTIYSLPPDLSQE